MGKYFVILRDVGCTPEKKGGFASFDRALGFVREVVNVRPDTTHITLVHLYNENDISVEDGRVALHIAGAMEHPAGYRNPIFMRPTP